MRSFSCLLLIAGLLVNSLAYAFTQSEQFSDFELKDLQSDAQGFIKSTSSDGFLVLNNIVLTRAQMCGLILDMEFQETPFRATAFEIYWRTENSAFSESQKGSFIINQNDASQQNTYLIPLCKLYGFSGNLNQSQNQANITSIRIDYPPNKTVAVRFNVIRFVDTKTTIETARNEAVIVLEPYERIAGRSATSLDVIVPKLIFSFEEGLSRLSQDVPFLVFWLLLIVFFKGLILWSYVRQFRRDN